VAVHDYGNDVNDGVCVLAGAGVKDAVDEGEAVEMNVDVAPGICVAVAGMGVDEGVEEGKTSVMVTPGMGVRVGMLGTHSRWPEYMVVEDPMQLPCCNCG